MRYSTSEMAKDIIEIVDHLGWTGERELNVVGISMGGMIAQEIVSTTTPCFILSVFLARPTNDNTRPTSSRHGSTHSFFYLPPRA